VYCGKTADSIRVPFGVVSGVGRWNGDRQRGRESFDGSTHKIVVPTRRQPQDSVASYLPLDENLVKIGPVVPAIIGL